MYSIKNNDLVRKSVYSIIRKQHSLVSDLANYKNDREIAKMRLNDFIQGVNGVLTIDEMDAVLKTLEKFGASATDFRHVTSIYGDLKDYSKFTANLMCRLDNRTL